MKLIGSITEQKIREELLASKQLFDDGRLPLLRRCVEARRPALESAILLDWTPEQGEDLFVLLLDGREIATVELLKTGVEVAFSMETIRGYERSLRGKIGRIRLAVAREIASEPRPADVVRIRSANRQPPPHYSE